MYIRVSEGSGRARTPVAPFDLEFLGHPLGLAPTLPDARNALMSLVSQHQAGIDPNSVERQRIVAETKNMVAPEPNPYFGLTDTHLEATLLASTLSAAMPVRQPPEVLLALWTKEGSHGMRNTAVSVTSDSDFANLMSGGSVTTSANARVLVRSFILWNDLGMDSFVYYPAGAKDNRPILNDATVAEHEKKFSSIAQNLTAQKFLPMSIDSTVTSELSVTTPAPGRLTFGVTPSTKFYGAALTLMGGLFPYFQTQPFALLGSGPMSPMSVGLGYIHWNMGPQKFEEFLQSAEKYRKLAKLANIEQWALHTPPVRGQWETPRTRAIKVEFLVRAYRRLFLPPPPPMFVP